MGTNCSITACSKVSIVNIDYVIAGWDLTRKGYTSNPGGQTEYDNAKS